MCIITLFSDCFCHINTLFVELLQTALPNCSFQVYQKWKNKENNKKYQRKKAQTVSYDDAVADILNWVENLDNDENFELETSRFSNDSDDSYQERNSIQYEQEEEEKNLTCHVTEGFLLAAGQYILLTLCKILIMTTK